MHLHHSLPGKAVAAVAALATAGLFRVMPTAHAGSSDSDGDGIPNRWERSHGMNPFKAADARADLDKDGLANLAEYSLGGQLRDEDTDNDGHDDGDEVKDGSRSTNVLDADTDNDGIEDGDEDADNDGIDNEDENELGGQVNDSDSDNDGVEDGNEDADNDGIDDEDGDDSLDDDCSSSDDEDEEEEEDDRVGTFVS